MKSSDLKAEQLALSSDDEDVGIGLIKSRRPNYLGTVDGTLVMGRDGFKLRMVRAWPDEDKKEYEIPAANLPRDLFQAECFGGIYHLRRRIGTAYRP